MQGASGIFEARVDDSYRLTYEYLPRDVLRLLAAGKHDEILRKPKGRRKPGILLKSFSQ